MEEIENLLRNDPQNRPIMHELTSVALAEARTPDHAILPCHFFDFMVGTSTGGYVILPLVGLCLC